VPTTQSARGTAAIAPPLTTHDFSSSSNKDTFADNAPTVLVRNCAEISLEAVTNPPNQSVTWNVKDNPGGDSTPSLTPSGNTAKLATDAAGGYSISATLDGTVIYWNVVFVDVKIKTSSVLTNDAFKDISRGGFVGASTGIFDNAQPAKCGMYAKAEVTVTAGGDASLNTYLDKVHVGFPQNMTNDTAAATYENNGNEKERVVQPPRPASPIVDPAINVTDLGTPVLDRGGAAGTRATGGSTIFLSHSASTPDSGADRVVEVCDSPAVGFHAKLPKLHGAATDKALAVGGVNAFRVYLAAYSDDANFSYVVFGQYDWTADYSGSIDNSTANPKWVKGAAAVTGDNSVTAIAGGKEAQAAGCEVRPPVYLDYVLDAR
jgi:hypothetical protein